jgi:hypothetical protein
MQYLWWVLVVWKLVEIALYSCLLMLLSATYTGHILKFNINVATDKSYNGPHQIYEHIRSDWLRWLWQEFNSVATISQQIYSPSLGTVVFTFEAINNARRNLLWQYFFVRNKFKTHMQKPSFKVATRKKVGFTAFGKEFWQWESWSILRHTWKCHAVSSCCAVPPAYCQCI